jgi:hypothetical protein
MTNLHEFKIIGICNTSCTIKSRNGIIVVEIAMIVVPVPHLKDCVCGIASIFIKQINMMNSRPQENITIITLLIEPHYTSNPEALEEGHVAFRGESEQALAHFTRSACGSTKCDELSRNDP